MFYDFHKNMTTINAGSIVLIATIAEKFSNNHHLNRIHVNAILLFMLSILGGIIAMVNSPGHAGGKRMGLIAKIYFSIGMYLTIAAFGGALLCLEIDLLKIDLFALFSR